MAPCRSATSQISAIGAMSPSIEYTDSNATSFGASGGRLDSLRSRSAGSLCAKTSFSARLWRMPSIMEAWLLASGQHDAARQPDRQGAERRPVGHVAGVEQQRRLGAVQVRQLLLQQHVVVVGAGDVAGAAGAGAAAVQRLVHRGQHGRVLAHAEVVVGAPHRHLGRPRSRTWVAGGSCRPRCRSANTR